MSLREAVEAANQRQAKFLAWEQRKPGVIEEWRNAIEAVHSLITRDYLEEYINKGAIGTNTHDADHYEDALGNYQAKDLIMNIGDLTCVLTSEARMEPRTTGTLKCYNQGTAATFRLRRVGDGSASQWQVAWAQDSAYDPDAHPAWQYIVLNRDTFQAALNHIIV